MVSLIQSWWRGLALDLRSLALLRICFGALLLLDLAVRLGDLGAHYTDLGTQPRSQVLQWGWHPAYWSLHMIQGHWLGQLLFFVVAALASLSLAVGYRTRLSGWLAWVMLISLQNRNPMILDGGDLYLRCLLFWLNFCPWGARFSVDARRAPPQPESSAQVWNAGAAAYCWQLTLIYFFAYYLKSGREWTVDGSAVEYALRIEQLTSPPAQWLLQHSSWLKTLNFSVLYFEGLVCLLFWVHPLTRLLGVLGVTCLHLGLASFLHLGVFAPVATVCTWGLIPTCFWERVGGGRKGVGNLSWPLPGYDVPTHSPGRLTSLLILVLLGRITYCNIFWSKYLQLPGRTPDLRLLRLDQQWNMFAPRPLQDDGYYVVVGESEQGDWLNLWLSGPPEVVWDKPFRGASFYPNARWRKLMMNLCSPDYKNWRQPLLGYLVRHWGEQHPGQYLRSARLYFVNEKTQPDFSEGPLEVRLLGYLAGHAVDPEQSPTTFASLASGLDVLRSLENSAGK